MQCLKCLNFEARLAVHGRCIVCVGIDQYVDLGALTFSGMNLNCLSQVRPDSTSTHGSRDEQVIDVQCVGLEHGRIGTGAAYEPDDARL